jgi:hypothetical protein
LSGDKVKVRVPGPLDDDEFAAGFQLVFEFVNPLTANIDLMAQRRVGDPCDPTAVVGMETEDD